MPPEIKFCGLTRPEDAAVALALGASYLGVIFAGGPRRLTAERALDVFGQATSGHDAGAARRVGVFGAQTPTAIADIARRARLDIVQLHGDPDPAAVEQIRAMFSGPIWGVVHIAEGSAIPSSASALAQTVDALVLDTKVAGQLGGTGRPFDWAQVALALEPLRANTRLILAGGLTPENIGRAIALLSPAVVDVSSGVESAPGIKDHARMRAFAAAVSECEAPA